MLVITIAGVRGWARRRFRSRPRALNAWLTAATVEMKINFLRPVWKARLRAEAKAIQHGKNLCVFECDVRDDERRLTARATATMMSLTGEQAEGRAHFD